MSGQQLYLKQMTDEFNRNLDIYSKLNNNPPNVSEKKLNELKEIIIQALQSNCLDFEGFCSTLAQQNSQFLASKSNIPSQSEYIQNIQKNKKYFDNSNIDNEKQTYEDYIQDKYGFYKDDKGVLFADSKRSFTYDTPPPLSQFDIDQFLAINAAIDRRKEKDSLQDNSEDYKFTEDELLYQDAVEKVNKLGEYIVNITEIVEIMYKLDSFKVPNILPDEITLNSINDKFPKYYKMLYALMYNISQKLKIPSNIFLYFLKKETDKSMIYTNQGSERTEITSKNFLILKKIVFLFLPLVYDQFSSNYSLEIPNTFPATTIDNNILKLVDEQEGSGKKNRKQKKHKKTKKNLIN